eukprot:4995022-Pleurochrysis_carterae.AAC.1
MLERPESRRRECDAEFRLRRDANMTLADVDGGAETAGRGDARDSGVDAVVCGVVACMLATSSPTVAAAVCGFDDVARRGEMKAAQTVSLSCARHNKSRAHQRVSDGAGEGDGRADPHGGRVCCEQMFGSHVDPQQLRSMYPVIIHARKRATAAG